MSCSVCAGYSSYNCPCCGNEVDTCHVCHGRGHMGFFRFNVVTRETSEVSEEEYDMLPDDEDMAQDLGFTFCKAELAECFECHGLGEI